ncbi:hypothetical protein [Arthrobacter sp. LFS091]|uniref:hypothetical protein n=1 Tax=Arthrobacter sp. LFS091 TaxID=3229892 RepID=UPI003A809A95
MSTDEVDMLKWPEPLPSSWQCVRTDAPEGRESTYQVTKYNKLAGEVRVVFTVAHPIGAAYPAGARDRLLIPDAETSAAALQLVSEQVMASDPACRRLVLAVRAGDVPGIARGERAGFRYVLDVDLPDGSVSLLAAEPDAVLESSRHLDDIPTS